MDGQSEFQSPVACNLNQLPFLPNIFKLLNDSLERQQLFCCNIIQRFVQQENSSYVGPAVLLSGTLKSPGAGPTGPLEKIAKIRAGHFTTIFGIFLFGLLTNHSKQAEVGISISATTVANLFIHFYILLEAMNIIFYLKYA